MFIKVSSLCKAEVAVRLRAGVRPLIGVDPQVIKEIMPFSEMFTAFFMVAF
jgi:hypothetical protein